MSIDTSIVSQNNTNSIVINENSSSREEEKKQANYANSQVILAEFLSAMALFRIITEIMWQFQAIARDNAMKSDQLYNKSDYMQVQTAFDKKVASLKDMLNVNQWSAGTQIAMGAISAGVGLRTSDAFAASAFSTIADSVGNGTMRLWNAPYQTGAEIKGQEADVQHHQSRFYAETRQNRLEWSNKMSGLIAETGNIATQIYQQLGRTFSASFQ